MIKLLLILLQSIFTQITFHDQPYVYVSSNNSFTSIITSAQENTVRILVLGDSQETCPGGAGIYYIPYLHYNLYTKTGNIPETPISVAGSFSNDFLIRGSAAAPGIIMPSRMVSSNRGPNLSGFTTYILNNIQNYGQLIMLQPFADDVSSQCELPNVRYFDTDTPVYAEIFGITNGYSGEIHVDVKPTNINIPNYFKPITQTFNSNLGLSTMNYNVIPWIIGPLNFNNLPYLQIELSGTNINIPTDILGVRFISSNPIGYSISSYSQGGYTSHHIHDYHYGSGPIINAFNPDIIWITYGANDAAAGNGLNPDIFKMNILWLIDFIKQSTNNNNLHFILIPDAYTTSLGQGGTKYSYWEQYINKCIEIANEQDNILVINSCRKLYEMGLNEQNYAVFLSDGVHYNPYGASTKASLEINYLYSLICNTDLNNDGNINQDDIIYLIDAIAGYNPHNIDTDINHDGNSDQDDIYYLINLVAAGC